MKSNLKDILGAIGRQIVSWFSLLDAVFVAGVGAVGYGIFQISPPWAWIIVGAFFVMLTTYGRFK